MRLQPELKAIPEEDCNVTISFNETYPERCPFSDEEWGEDEQCDADIKSGQHESQCSNSGYDGYTSTVLRLGWNGNQ